jgi:hypothetical protein
MTRKLNGRLAEDFLVQDRPRFVVPASMKPGALKTLDDILMLFGPGGENWIKGMEHRSYDVGDWDSYNRREVTKAFDAFCLIGGVQEVDGAYEGIARLAISLAVIQYDGATARKAAKWSVDTFVDCVADGEVIPDFNDLKSVKFADIKAVVRLARKLVLKADVK